MELQVQRRTYLITTNNFNSVYCCKRLQDLTNIAGRRSIQFLPLFRGFARRTKSTIYKHSGHLIIPLVVYSSGTFRVHTEAAHKSPDPPPPSSKKNKTKKNGRRRGWFTRLAVTKTGLKPAPHSNGYIKRRLSQFCCYKNVTSHSSNNSASSRGKLRRGVIQAHTVVARGA